MDIQERMKYIILEKDQKINHLERDNREKENKLNDTLKSMFMIQSQMQKHIAALDQLNEITSMQSEI